MKAKITVDINRLWFAEVHKDNGKWVKTYGNKTSLKKLIQDINQDFDDISVMVDDFLITTT